MIAVETIPPSPFFPFSKPLPTPVEGQHTQNDLDRHLRYYREIELTHIRRHALAVRENARSIEDAMADVDSYLAQLKALAVEVNSLGWILYSFHLPHNDSAFRKYYFWL